MSLIGALGNSLSGMRAIQADMQVISTNVSSAGQDGYTKKSLVLKTTSTSDGTGGVSITGYSRATSDTVTNLLNQALSDNGKSGTQKDFVSRIQDLLGSTQDNPILTSAMSAFASSWQALAASPEDTTRKQDVIFKAQNLTREVTRLAAGLDTIATQANDEMATAVDTLNTSLSRIATLNNEIVTAESSKQSPVDLMDERDAEVRKISELMKINVVKRGQDRISIYTPGGTSLLDATANSYSWDGTSITSNSTDVTSVLKGGKIEALAGILDQGSSATTLNDPGKASIYKIKQQLDKIVDLFSNPASTFATAYNTATTGTGELGSAFFTAGATRYTFTVNTALVTGTSLLKQSAAAPVAADMGLATRNISAGNMTATGVSYEGFTNAIIYTHNQNTKQVSDQASIYAGQKDTYTKKLNDEVGVNVDEEVVRLTQLQNNYAASAHVISAVQQMFDILDKL